MLDARSRRVLQAVVETYINDAEPVSSAVVSRLLGNQCSAATLRNVMADLTAQGLLSQPHTSAGRIPTERGLRTYLDNMLNEKLHPWDRTSLEATLKAEDPSEFPAHLGQSLAGLSGQLAVVAVPRFISSRFREVGIVRCDSGRFLAYFVSPGGLVQQKLVDVDFDLSGEEVIRAQNFLNEHLQGRTLEDVRLFVARELLAAEQERWRLQALTLCDLALPQPETTVWVEGATQLLQQPEFSDSARLRSVLKTVEDKEMLLRLLDRVLDGSDVQVLLTSEHSVTQAPDLACVASRLSSPTSVAIGLLGPSRMDYGRLVPMVRVATELFTRYWQTHE